MSFTCPVCGMTSHNPSDEREGYCGRCQDFTGVGEILNCDVCGASIAPDEFVALVRVRPNHYVVAQVGIRIGDMIDADVYAHAACIEDKGEQIGTLQIGQG